MRIDVLAVVVGVLGAAWLSHTQAVAADASADTLRAARELVQEVSKDDLVQQIVDRSWPSFEPQIRASMPQASPAQIAGFRADYERIVAEHAKDIVGATPIIYAKYFTADELRDVLAFYRSPTGRKTLKVMPQVVADSVQLSMARMPDVIADIDQAFRSSLKQKGVDLPI